MYVAKVEKNYITTEVAMAFYTYILHMKIDVNTEKIVFIYQENQEFYRIILDCTPNKSFDNIISSANVEKVDKIKDLCDGENFICLFLDNTDEKEIMKKYKNMQIIINQKENLFEFYLQDGFSYNQKENFEKFFLRTLSKICDNYSCSLENFSILEKQEKQEIKNLYNNQVKYDENKTILDYFNEYLREHPSKACVTFKNKDYSYTDIDLESNYIANKLIQMGIKNQNGVVIFMERSSRVISSILATMKCNCYYIPIDISTPIERVKTICNESHAFAMLTDNKTNDEVVNAKIKKIKVFNLEDIDVSNLDMLKDINIQYKHSPNDYRYIIYTSGTTGTPKGVAIKNKNIGNFVINNVIDKNLKDKDNSAIIAANKIGFDAFVADSLLPLAIGLRIVMASAEDLINPKSFIKTIEDSHVNVIQTTPTRLNLSILDIEPEILKKFDVIACGGEPLLPIIINKIKYYSDACIINVYGPTETTVWSTSACITKGDKGIGKPSVNQNCYILNRYMQILPRYETGIIYISGKGLGEYSFDKLNQNLKYIHCSEIDDVAYNTGDTAYIDSDNYIMFKSRVDTQVKINGVRIELSEIENVTLELKEIKECAAVVKDIPNVGKRIILYYTENKPISDEKIRKYLLSKLPKTYVPAFIIKFSKMPLTSSNKIDKKALPMPEINNLSGKEILLPRNAFEQTIYDTFKKIRPDLNFGINTSYEGNFDSLDLITIYSSLKDKGFNISLDTIAHSSTILQIVDDLQKQKSNINLERYPRYAFDTYSNVLKYKNILLTGATGFLGIHILEYLLKNTDSNIICLVHNNTDIEKVYNEYQMKTPYDRKRIIVIKGDLSKEDFDLDYQEKKKINLTDVIINCAAYVNYYGNKSNFENSNILAVRNLSKFAINNNIILNHISTLSVLGSDSKIPINENDLYFGQNIHCNQYVESKFMGELELQKAKSKGLKYRNFRIGRLAWRFRDNKFQINSESNEFYMSLLLFKKMHMVPASVIDVQVEISPIEYCAKAICLLIEQNRINGNFHVMNNNLIKVKDIISYMNEYNTNIKIVPDEVFMKAFNSDNSELKKKNIICINNGKFQIENNPFIKNDMTKILLEEKNFYWPHICKEYFEIFKEIN